MNEGKDEDAAVDFPIQDDMAAVLMAAHARRDALGAAAHARVVGQKGEAVAERSAVTPRLVWAKEFDTGEKDVPEVSIRAG